MSSFILIIHAEHSSDWVRAAVFTVKFCQMCNAFLFIMSLASVSKPLYKINTKKEMGRCSLVCKTLYYTNFHQSLRTNPHLIFWTNDVTNKVTKSCFWLIHHMHVDLLSLTALCGTASGATGLSRSTSCMRAHRTGSLCLSLYFGYRPSRTAQSSSYTLV